jgi:protein-S-isoprenylcysteine O-methyltransferase Ste14
MQDIKLKALGGTLLSAVILGLCLFLPAWTFHFWQAWVFLGVNHGCAVAVTVYLFAHDRGLLERRMQVAVVGEKRKLQKVIQSFSLLEYLALFIVSSLDHRFAWSFVPAYLVAAGDLLVALGYFVVFLVFKENSFASATIEVGSLQHVVSTGPYAFVRHPMYAGALVLFLGMPLALGSWWGLLAVIPLVLTLAWRLLDEERLLAMDLMGYPEYCGKVRYHLVPWVW